MTLLRWLSKPRLSYLDAVIIVSSTALYPVIGWWHLAVAVLGMFLSVAIEQAVWR